MNQPLLMDGLPLFKIVAVSNTLWLSYITHIIIDVAVVVVGVVVVIFI